MKISIVCATYRGAARTKKLLESIRESARGAGTLSEILVYDDGSPEADRRGLEEVVRKLSAGLYPMTVGLLAGARRGWVAAVNDAVPRTSGEAILLMDDDTLMPPGLLGVLDQLLSLSGVGVLSWRSQGDKPGQSQVARPGFVQPATEIAAYCMAFRRSLWNELGGLDPRYQVYCSDSDLALRATLSGHPCYRVWWPLVPHEEHQCAREANEIDWQAIAQQDAATFRDKWGKSGAEREREALWGLQNV